MDRFIKEWQGIPIKDYDIDSEPDYANTIYRFCYSWEDEIETSEKLDEFLSSVDANDCPGIILGTDSPDAGGFHEDVLRLIDDRRLIPNLRFLFLGEILDTQLSWIPQTDVGAPVLEAFPALEDLRARGGTYDFEAIGFSAARQICLRKLVLQTAGLPKGALEGLKNSVFPELENLELWLGAEEYGKTFNPQDLSDFLEANPFPMLKQLSLNNYEFGDDLVPLLVEAPMIAQLESLDLSMVTIGEGAARDLVNSPHLGNLKKLVFCRYQLTDAVIEELQGKEGIEVSFTHGSYYYESIME